MIEDAYSPSWVYDFADYLQMFNLDTVDLEKKILDFPGGISSFNAQAHADHQQVISIDSIYKADFSTMQQDADAMLAKREQDMSAQQQEYLQSQIDIKEIFTTWRQTVARFLQDYPSGYEQGRYVHIGSTTWPFQPHQFDIALCSDLNLYELDNLNLSLLDIIKQLVRISKEIRIFPLLSASGNIATDWGPVMLWLQEHNFGQEIKQIDFQQLCGSNAMLRIWATECELDRE